MNATILIIAAAVAAAVLVTVNTLLLARGGAQDVGGTPADEVHEEASAATAPEPRPPALAAPHQPDPIGAGGAIALGSASPDLARLRAIPGVRGVALWGREGALLLAEGELMAPLLPEASSLMKSVTSAASGLGSGHWASFAVEGVDGTIQGVRVGGLSLVVVTATGAERKEVERLLHEAASSSHASPPTGDGQVPSP